MISFLTFLVIVLGLITFGRIIRIFELSAELRGTDVNAVNGSDNKTNSLLLLIMGSAFVFMVFYLTYAMKDKMLPSSASEHGVEIDTLFAVNWYILFAAFFITHALLIYFAAKYYFKKEHKPVFFAHSTKLELIWTLIPAAVLSVIIVYGISKWNKIVAPAGDDVLVIELYAKQFDWTARYAGDDNELGKASFRLIDGSNPLGIEYTDPQSADDILVRNEFHLPVGKEVVFKFHSRDVIHSAYMPHFRAQMNCVPGMTTQFHFKPIKTTEEMRVETANDKFDYILLCNKICGASHFNMQMNIIVEDETSFRQWLGSKKTVAEELKAAAPAATVEVKTDSLAAPADSAKVHAVTADATKH
jgi:cytochrome c oxidase subunit 2